MNEPAVLLISKDAAWIQMAESLIREVGPLRAAVVGGLDQAYAYEGWDRVALVLVQHRRGEAASGVARLFRMLAASRRAIATLVLGEGIDEETELDLLRRGAADCLLSPYDLDRLSYLIETLTLRARQPDAGRISPAVAEGWDDSDPTVAQARRVAGQDATILIRGEAGTGKSRLARIIHELSPRKGGPLVTLRCGALTPEGFEEELFGGPGEADGPSASVVGKLEAAREGTLVLDDVDALTPTAQVALLRWVEEGSRESSSRVRGRPNRPRIVATTRSALGDKVAEGGFRSDLFFRLNVIGLELPPLRQRKVEIVSIALGVLAEVAGRSVTLSSEAISGLEGYPWPGNVREMREVLEAAVTAGGRDVVVLEHLPEAIRAVAGRHSPRRAAEAAEAEGTSTLAETKREAEFHRITQALQRNGNNRLRTASELGISRMTLYKKLYKYGIIEPSASGHRGSPGRSRGQGPPRGPDDAGGSSPRAPGGTGEPSGADGASASRPGGSVGRPRQEKSAPALH